MIFGKLNFISTTTVEFVMCVDNRIYYAPTVALIYWHVTPLRSCYSDAHNEASNYLRKDSVKNLIKI